MKSESLADLVAWQPPKVKYIISHGILLPETRMIIYGRYGSWKSMLAIHTAFCLAEGRTWITYTVAPSKSLLVQTELPKSPFRDRVLKYAKGNEINSENIYFWTEVGLRLDTPYGLAALDAELKERQPQVLIIDPIYKTMTQDISKSVDVQKLLDNIDLEAHRYNLAVILIGHSGKKMYAQDSGIVIDRGADALLGSSYFQDWVDTIISITDLGNDSIRLDFEKYRNSEVELMPVNLKIDREKLSFNII